MQKTHLGVCWTLEHSFLLTVFHYKITFFSFLFLFLFCFSVLLFIFHLFQDLLDQNSAFSAFLLILCFWSGSSESKVIDELLIIKNIAFVYTKHTFWMNSCINMVLRLFGTRWMFYYKKKIFISKVLNSFDFKIWSRRWI